MKKYPDEFKREALRLSAQPGMKVALVEQPQAKQLLLKIRSVHRCRASVLKY